MEKVEKVHEPILPGQGTSDYERYLRTDELLALQKSPGEMVHHDELLFQTVHQSSELWLKLAAVEVETATDRLRSGQLAAAIRLLRRAAECIRLITTQIHMLEHMSPWEYQTLRKALGHGSGFDSPGFRRMHEVSPPIGEVFARVLEDRQLTLIELYQRGRELEDIYQLAELLIDWDEQLLLWRTHHLKVVERIIGGKVVGTQGTPVEVLGKRVEHRFFPDLWEVRNQLTTIASRGPDAPVSDGH